MRLLAVVVLAACGRGERVAPQVAAPAHGDAAPADAAAVCATGVRTLAPGITAERWPIAATPAAGTPCLDVVRADLAHYRLRALAGDSTERHTAPEWRDREHLLAVINAGMFHASGAPVGFLIDGGTVHGTDNPKFGGFLAWDPVAPTDALAVVTGRTCTGFDLAALRKRYRSLTQSYRLIGCDGEAIAWQDPKQYSAAAIGLDRTGRVVFLHARGAVTMAELSTAASAHDLAGALFLEGGPEASLIAGDLALLGSYETGFVDNDDNHDWWQLPNVIGLAAK